VYPRRSPESERQFMQNPDPLQAPIHANNGWLPRQWRTLRGSMDPRSTPDNRRNCDSNHSLQLVPVSEFKTHRERRVLVSSMQIPTRECARTACSLACELIDKLTVIVGNCDLLRDKMEAGSPESERLDMIRGIAKEIAKELGGCQCRLLEAVRSVGGQKHYVV
jgi:hypothetical protein